MDQDIFIYVSNSISKADYKKDKITFIYWNPNSTFEFLINGPQGMNLHYIQVGFRLA